MESLLERGEKLDDLVAKSEHLGNQSKAFYKTVSLNDWPYWHYAKFQDCALNLLSRAYLFVFNLQARKQNSCCEIMWCRCLVLLGHASLSLPFCFSYNSHHPPATSSQPRQFRGRQIQDGTPRREQERMASLKCDLCGLWLMGAEGVMGFGQGGKVTWIIFNHWKGKHLCSFSVPAGDISVTSCIGDVSLKCLQTI